MADNKEAEVRMAEAVPGTTPVAKEDPIVVEPDEPVDRLRVQEEGVKFDDEYSLGEELGSGAMSVVRVGTHKKTGARFAVKCISKDPLDLEDEGSLLRECNIMQRLDHPHIVKLHGFFNEAKMFYLVMDLIQGGELFERITKKEYYSEKDARDLIQMLLETVNYLHEDGVVHRDLKPENLLCVSNDDDTTVKLCDFGFADTCPRGQKELTQLCGTPGYCSPEILRRQPYGVEVDMWSAGVITYILLGGYPPFYDDDSEQLYESIKAGRYEFHDQFWAEISDEAKDFIRKLLTVDPDARMSAKAGLDHPWLKSTDVRTKALDANLKQLKLYQTKKKFKAAAKAVVATHRIKGVFGGGLAVKAQSKAAPPATNDAQETQQQQPEDETIQTVVDSNGNTYYFAKPEKGDFEAAYEFGKELGTGALSVVRLVTHRETNVQFACKCVEKMQLHLEEREALLAEAALMKELNHQNIVRLHSFYDDGSHYLLVMDLISGGELFDRIVKKEFYDEKEARDLIRVLLEILKYLHDERGIVHRDIKPENVLCVSESDDTNIKLCDFGFAARVDPSNRNACLTNLCGTPGYVSPEILKHLPYGTAVDMWSCGVLTYILLGGYPPFYDDDQNRLYDKIKHGVFEFHPEYWAQISHQGKDLIKKMLTVNPSQRITAAKALEHPWITGSKELKFGTKLEANLKALRKFNAKRKFKLAGKKLIAARRLGIALRPCDIATT